MDWITPETLYWVAIFVVPGYIIATIRDLFLEGAPPLDERALLRYIVFSLVYLCAFGWIGALLPAFPGPYADTFPGEPTTLAVWGAALIAPPVLIGFLLGVSARSDWIRRGMRLGGSNHRRSARLAWDRAFSRHGGRWVRVTLKDGATVAGFWSAESFASSDPADRDIFLGRVFRIDQAGVWSPAAGESVLIRSGEIASVAFWEDAAAAVAAIAAPGAAVPVAPSTAAVQSGEGSAPQGVPPITPPSDGAKKQKKKKKKAKGD